MSASSTTFMPISGSTTERSASRMASSVARRSVSKGAIGCPAVSVAVAVTAACSGPVVVFSVVTRSS